MEKGDSHHRTYMVFKAHRALIQDEARMMKVEYRTVMMVRWLPPLYFESDMPFAQ